MVRCSWRRVAILRAAVAFNIAVKARVFCETLPPPSIFLRRVLKFHLRSFTAFASYSPCSKHMLSTRSSSRRSRSCSLSSKKTAANPPSSRCVLRPCPSLALPIAAIDWPFEDTCAYVGRNVAVLGPWCAGHPRARCCEGLCSWREKRHPFGSTRARRVVALNEGLCLASFGAHPHPHRP